MDTSGISNMATSMSQARTAEAVQMAVLKKSMDIRAQSGMQLVQAAANAAPSNPPHLGNKIDTYA